MEKRLLILKLVQSVMSSELDANIDKGDNWTDMTKKDFLFELYYHVGKLQSALAIDDIDKIKEFTGDILNNCGFLLDTLNKGLLTK